MHDSYPLSEPFLILFLSSSGGVVSKKNKRNDIVNSTADESTGVIKMLS